MTTLTTNRLNDSLHTSRQGVGIKQFLLASAAPMTMAALLAGGYIHFESKLSVTETALAASESSLASLEESITSARDSDLSSVAVQATSRVVMVGVVHPDSKSFMQVGTAWLAERESDGMAVLATNAHVVESARDLADTGASIVIRQTQANGQRDFPVLETKSHPTYKEFEWIGNRPVGRAAGTTLNWSNLIAVADVGVLRVRDNGMLGEPLRVASQDEIERLHEGTKVAAVGFPAENMAGARDLAPASVATGSVIAMTDFAGSAAPRDDQWLLHHDIRFTGGSSGSPIVVSDPRTAEPVVIGIHSAQDVMPSDYGRVPIASSYAQRVDLLEDLTSNNRRQDRSGRVEVALSRLVGDTGEVLDSLESIALDYFEMDGPTRPLRDWSGSIPGGASGFSDVIAEFQVQAGEIYMLFGYSDNWMDLNLRVLDGRHEYTADTAADGIPICAFRAQRDSVVRVIGESPETYDAGSTFHIRAVRVGR